MLCTKSEFFDFMVLATPSAADGEEPAKGLSLHKLIKSSLGLSGLLQVQAALINHWFDFVQKTPDPDRCLHCIPESLWKPHFLRTLGLETYSGSSTISFHTRFMVSSLTYFTLIR